MSKASAALGSYPQSPDPTLNDPQWLQQLSSHPIFTSHPTQDARRHPRSPARISTFPARTSS